MDILLGQEHHAENILLEFGIALVEQEIDLQDYPHLGLKDQT